MTNRIEDILDFWFGSFPTPYTADSAKADMWFKNGASYDSEIFINFGVDYDRAINGELDHWIDSHRGRLALIILLDQFSRHIHRGTAAAFAQDEKAQALCIDGIGAGDDSKAHSATSKSRPCRKRTQSSAVFFICRLSMRKISTNKTYR